MVEGVFRFWVYDSGVYVTYDYSKKSGGGPLFGVRLFRCTTRYHFNTEKLHWQGNFDG